MANSLNKVTLIGNLGKDPEVRNTSGGVKIVNLTIATSESWVDKASGERKEKSEWHRVVIFNDNLAGIAEKYSTEIVLDRFGSTLIVLDPKGGVAPAAAKTAQRASEPGDDYDAIPF
jgi:single-strand DNA-binding protein